jgi:hypothetical protein
MRRETPLKVIKSINYCNDIIAMHSYDTHGERGMGEKLLIVFDFVSA